jgi:hypothetical protein
MYLRRALSSAALVAAAASACVSPRPAGGDGAVLTEKEATNAMFVAAELPGKWRTTEVPVRPDGSVSDSEMSGSECGQAAQALAKEASRWGAANINVEAAWTSPGGDMLLKQEIASDSDLEPARLVELLGRQVSECSDVTAVTEDLTVESHMRACDLDRGEVGIQIVHSWTASNGGAGSTRFAYIVHGHSVVVLTLVTVDSHDSCDHAVFDRVVAAAAAKVA